MRPNPQSFRDFAALGYTCLVPIIPPDAEISENSSLLKRKDARGKAVGVRGREGKWFGFDWLKHEATPEDYDRWQAMGAGVGIKTGGKLVLIDADAPDKENAKIIRDVVTKYCGELPARIGRYPKVGYPVRVTTPVQYCRVEFGERNERGELKDRVEILSEGRQFVAHGIHPVTREPYSWPRPLVPLDDLPQITGLTLRAMMTELQSLLPAARPLITEGSTTAVNQDALKGDIALVRRAVGAIPNTSKHFATRESYRDIGYAIKAALPDNPAEAFEIYSDWCDRWEEGTNLPDTVEADWRRMRPPFRRGAGWLFELAEQHSPDKFNRAEQWYEPVVERKSVFGETSKPEPVQIEWRRPSEWKNKEIPPREWEVEGLIPRGEVTLLYGDGGVGKSLLAHQYATAAAGGVDWLGVKTRPARVMGFFCEDSEDELHRRQVSLCSAMGLTLDDIDESLRVVSRRFMDNLLSLWERHSGVMRRTSVWDALRRDVENFAADVVLVDTLADVYGGSEIERSQVNAFVKACLGRLTLETGCSVIALGHPSQSGKARGDGTSGSTAWNNAARSRLYLRRLKDNVQNSNLRELEGMKANYGPAGTLLKLRWVRGAFETVAGSVLVPIGDNAAASKLVGLADAAQAAVISALMDNPKERLNLTLNSPYYAPKVLLKLNHDALAPFGAKEIVSAMVELERRGVIRADVVGQDNSYRKTFGFTVNPDKLSASVLSKTTIFD